MIRTCTCVHAGGECVSLPKLRERDNGHPGHLPGEGCPHQLQGSLPKAHGQAQRWYAVDWTPPKISVLIRRLIAIGTTEKTVLIREVSLFQRLICAQKYTIGTSETREASLFQRCPLRGSIVEARLVHNIMYFVLCIHSCVCHVLELEHCVCKDGRFD